MAVGPGVLGATHGHRVGVVCGVLDEAHGEVEALLSDAQRGCVDVDAEVVGQLEEEVLGVPALHHRHGPVVGHHDDVGAGIRIAGLPAVDGLGAVDVGCVEVLVPDAVRRQAEQKRDVGCGLIGRQVGPGGLDVVEVGRLERLPVGDLSVGMVGEG